MARSSLLNTTEDLISDGGSVLWSIVTGEQLEFPVTLSFLNPDDFKANMAFEYEAVVIEADNVSLQTTRPVNIRAGGIQTPLVVRVPTYLGIWNANESYNWEEVTQYSGKYYKLLRGTNYNSSLTPDIDPNWVETTINRVYIQFPESLGSTWEVKAQVGSPVYGFFELRVTEPTTPYFKRTWKPIRGMVELLFSPTDYVPG